MAKGGSLYPSQDLVGLTGVLKNDFENIQTLLRNYLRSRPNSRPALAQEILDRLKSHLKMEENVLLEVVRSSGFHSIELVEYAILEHEEIQLQQSEMDDDQAW